MKLYIGEEKGIPVGMVRFDRYDKEENIYDVSINFSLANRGNGLAEKLLISALSWIFREEFEEKHKGIPFGIQQNS